MRASRDIMVDLAASGLTMAQQALIMELASTLSAEARPVVDKAAENKRAYDRERQNLLPDDWHERRQAVFERDGHKCVYCGSTENLAADHVVPLIQGGSSELDNLATACKSCNSSKSGRTPEQWLL